MQNNEGTEGHNIRDDATKVSLLISITLSHRPFR